MSIPPPSSSGRTTGEPSALIAGFDRASAALGELNATDLLALSSQELLDAVGRVETLRRKLDALDAKVIAATQADGAWASSGARTYAAWYRNETGRHRTTANRHVHQSRMLRDLLPEAANALGNAAISTDHVAALTQHAVTTPERRAMLQDPAIGESFLVEQARSMGAPQFLQLVKHWAIRTDPDAADRSWTQEADRQELVVAPTLGGYHVQGWLTPTSGQALLTALDARTGTPDASDTRTTAQRRADNLVSLAHLSLDAGVLRPGARIRPHISVTVPIDTLRRLVAAGSPGTSTTGRPTVGSPTSGSPTSGSPTVGTGISCPATDGTAGSPSGASAPRIIPGRLDYSALEGAEAATLADGEPIPHQLLARLACQGAFHRVIFGADSEILDVGREERLFTAAQTRAIIARDRHCQYPGCDAPPGEGEIHHSIWWYEHSGRTDAQLGLLLCWYHHDYVHRREISIERLGSTWQLTRTDGTIITPVGPGRSPLGSLPRMPLGVTPDPPNGPPRTTPTPQPQPTHT